MDCRVQPKAGHAEEALNMWRRSETDKAFETALRLSDIEARDLFKVSLRGSHSPGTNFELSFLSVAPLLQGKASVPKADQYTSWEEVGREIPTRVSFSKEQGQMEWG